MKAAFNKHREKTREKHLEKHLERQLSKIPSIKHRHSSVKVEDVRELQEQRLVEKFRQKLMSDSLDNLPEHLDDYHTMLRFLTYFSSSYALFIESYLHYAVNQS